MQDFFCPKCGHHSTFDPWKESARCPECGYSPLEGEHPRQPPPALEISDTHDRLVDEWVALWKGTHQPQRGLPVPTEAFAKLLFASYQQALGEDPKLQPGSHMQYVRNYNPSRRDIIAFVRAYARLRRGERDAAAKQLRRLTVRSPHFADPWLWLSAASSDSREQRRALERAVLAEPAHPLARDAWAIFSGRVSPSPAQTGDQGQTLTLIDCPRCAAPLHHSPGAGEVVCEYCGHKLPLQPSDLIDEPARLVADRRLQRRYESRAWTVAEGVVRCLSCGAQLVMSSHLARGCPHCGSTNVLVEASQRRYEQPDALLPFAIDREAAAQAVLTVQRSRWRKLRGQSSGSVGPTYSLYAIYLPFWAFDGFVEARLWGTAASIVGPPHEKLIDAQTMAFDNLLIPAVKVPPRDLLDEVLPYDLKALVRFEPPLIADRAVALYQLDVPAVLEEVYDAMLAMARAKAGLMSAKEAVKFMATHPEAMQSVQIRRTHQVSGVSYQLLLLPVWLARWRTAQGRVLAAVNGQDGRVAVREWQRVSGA